MPRGPSLTRALASPRSKMPYPMQQPMTRLNVSPQSKPLDVQLRVKTSAATSPTHTGKPYSRTCVLDSQHMLTANAASPTEPSKQRAGKTSPFVARIKNEEKKSAKKDPTKVS